MRFWHERGPKDGMSAVVILLGSFLLFGLQPLVGSLLLPAFGGTASTWTVCLCAYQVLLVAGYYYAHALTRRELTAGGAGVHAALLLVSAAWVFAIPRAAERILPRLADSGWPAVGTLAAVLAVIALPYVLLSANSTLVQVAASAASGDGDVYRLYAVSNAGSFCGLLAYPFAFERYFSVPSMFAGLSVGLALYAVLLLRLLRSRTKGEAADASRPVVDERDETPRGALVWLALSAGSCFLLDAVTAWLGQGVTPVPVMWALLLGLYLLSWILGFAGLGRRAALVACAGTVLAGFACVRLMRLPAESHYLLKFVCGTLLLFGGCLVIHDTLYRRRPEGRFLSRYYLAVAVGGGVGGLTASLLFPAVTDCILEYPIATVAVIALAAARLIGMTCRGLGERAMRWLASGTTLVVALTLSVAIQSVRKTDGRLLVRSRNFYAVTAVQAREARDAEGRTFPAVTMENNGTVHGMQALSLGKPMLMPTTYYTEAGGGMCIVQHPNRKSGLPIRAALCGMGIGTLTAHAKAGDTFRYFEIDPAVIDYASDPALFTFLSRTEATVEIVRGDARRSLEKERADGLARYDLIVVDVFSGDSIPVHMATREAFALYLDRLEPDGILAVHLSNWHLDLSPLIKAVAAEFALDRVGYVNVPDRQHPYEFQSHWAYFSRRPLNFERQPRQRPVDYSKAADIPLMSDDRHSVIPYIGRNNSLGDSPLTQVHAAPKNPMKIEFDPKKGR